MFRNIATRFTLFKVRVQTVLRRVPLSAAIHGIAATLHAANGDYAEAVTALCLAIAAARHH